ncbi:oxidoreductase [Nocardia wallacei]|uniref:oxidoreductase n=1 Tax=Nocardia wallacei TaxID=480035 RepID=UPI0024537B3B|nr:oxidoreductase [Nocardia wallacei]
MSKWTAADVPDQRGRVAVVTGANTGIGFETARVLATRGAAVLLACRDADRAKAAARRMAESAPGAAVGTVRIDLGSLSSVREAAAEIRDRHERIDLLINNAGVTGLRGCTVDGAEIQFGVNHLGHFALTGLVLDRLASGARVVSVSSIGHRFGRFDSAGNPCGTSAYADSKLANLLFTYELNRRLRAADRPVSALAAHPGGASTEVFRYSPPWFRIPNLAVAKLFGRTPAMGALPTLRAATDPTARGSEYYGPGGLFEIQGHPEAVTSSARSHDSLLQAALWSASEAATGVRYLG